jgi:hypothetical protein
MLPVDALGFRRGAGALKTLLADQGLSDHPLFAQAKGRGIRALSGHIESTDLTNDVNGGPSGVGSRDGSGERRRSGTSWALPMGTPKVIALEGEFAMTEGHAPGAQDPGHRAAGRQAAPDLPVRQQRRHRRFLDRWRCGQQVLRLSLVDQWTSYGWNVLTAAGWSRLRPDRGRAPDDGGLDPADRRPMIVIGTTTKGYWPGAVNGKIPGAGDRWWATRAIRTG